MLIVRINSKLCTQAIYFKYTNKICSNRLQLYSRNADVTVVRVTDVSCVCRCVHYVPSGKRIKVLSVELYISQCQADAPSLRDITATSRATGVRIELLTFLFRTDKRCGIIYIWTALVPALRARWCRPGRR